MKVIDFTTPDAIFIDLAAGSKKLALRSNSNRSDGDSIAAEGRTGRCRPSRRLYKGGPQFVSAVR